MIDRKVLNEGRKPWSTPELRRIEAGSAEAGSAAVADGGNPGQARS